MSHARPTVIQVRNGWQVQHWYGRPWTPPRCDHRHRSRKAAIRCYLRLYRRETLAALEADDEWWAEFGERDV